MLKYSSKTLMAGPSSCQGFAGCGKRPRRREIRGEKADQSFFLRGLSIRLPQPKSEMKQSIE
ncbi:hypothetical protein Taro_029815 [Colocasia esculenta]|uniref:Uncharacterized protein n=1 Tax=Colocasia esculenta TaxID=4460 RepID=A0A843VQ47_COLES|nr:hypothetical protein [Colocasia esculenta]